MTATDVADVLHGTRRGYMKSKCRCADCRAWAAGYMREYRATSPVAMERERERKAARARALSRLADMHPALYRALYAEEMGK